MAFADRCRAVQACLLEDLQHGDVDGVRVARKAARVQGWSQRAVFPVVFASVLDVDTIFLEDLPFEAPIIDSGLQTPQVLPGPPGVRIWRSARRRMGHRRRPIPRWIRRDRLQRV